MARGKKLRPKQQRFVDEYLVDLNATQAALRAGYSAQTSYSIGQENLKKPEIQQAISDAQAARSSRTHITQDRVLQEVATLSFSNIWHYAIDDHGFVTLAQDAPPEAIHAVSSIKRKVTHRNYGDGETEINYETELRLWDKNAALKMAGLHLGMFIEKREHTGAKGGPLLIQVVYEEDKPTSSDAD